MKVLLQSSSIELEAGGHPAEPSLAREVFESMITEPSSFQGLDAIRGRVSTPSCLAAVSISAILRSSGQPSTAS